MPYPGSYRKGDHRAVCDVCGQTFLAYQMRMRWDNLFVCREDWEIRHPQDFVRGVPDDMRAEPARPRQDPVFIDLTAFGGYLQYYDSSGNVGNLTQFNEQNIELQADT